MKLQLAQLKRMKFGRASEQLDAQMPQLELSLEELEANTAEAPIAVASATPASISTKPTRQALPADLPRESHHHESNAGTCNCPQCGGTLRAIGEDVYEMLEYVPEHWKVHRRAPEVQLHILRAPCSRERAVATDRAWLPSTATINRCIDRARSMLAQGLSSIAPHWPSGLAR